MESGVTAAHKSLELAGLGSNPSSPIKRCGSCHQNKELADFNRKGKGHQSRCRECNAAYGREWHQQNRDAVIARKLKRKRANRAWIAELKMVRGCNRCGYNRCSRALDFHHLESDKEVSVANGMDMARGRLLAEIEKCELLCANCHREEHAKQNNKEGTSSGR